GGHAADGGDVGAPPRRGREEEAVWAELAVERRVDHARLHVDLEIFGTDGDHLRHARAVEHDAAADRDRVALEARAGTARGERERMLDAEPHDRDHVVGRERPDDRVRARARERGGVARGGVQVGGAGGGADGGGGGGGGGAGGVGGPGG